MFGMGSNVAVGPNGVDVANREPSVSPEKTILFLGNYTYPPNAEAAERLISQIWPLIRQQVGTARLIIAGDYPELIPAYASSPPSVEFTGLVHDLEALYARSRVICCPIVNGGGTRVKLLEAAAYAKPIVATTVGAEGLSFENELEILIRNIDSEIAQACCRLLTDDALSLRLGTSAYQKACSHYELGHIRKNIAHRLADGLEGRSVAETGLVNDREHHYS
jgi:glycosyltransferase involved in cell wall biosynthesis